MIRNYCNSGLGDGKKTTSIVSGNSPVDGFYDVLMVDKRVMKAGSKIVQIPNISSVGIYENNDPGDRRVFFIVLSFLLFLFSLFKIYSSQIDLFLLLSAILSVAFLYFAMKMKYEYYLFIALNNGSVLKFVSKNRQFMREALDFISEKINSPDLDMRLEFDFSKGKTINENNSISAEQVNVDNVVTEKLVSGSNNTIAENNSGPVFGSGSAGNIALMGDDNQGVDVSSASTAIVADNHIEFGDLKNKVAALRDAMAKSDHYPSQTVEQLEELCSLMSEGVPTPDKKVRARELVGEVCNVVQTVPAAVTILNQVSSLLL